MALRITSRNGGTIGTGHGGGGGGGGGGGADCDEDRDRGKRVLRADKMFVTDFRAKKLGANSNSNPRARRPPLLPASGSMCASAAAAAAKMHEAPSHRQCRRQVPESLATLETGLQGAIDQAHSSTDCLQNTMNKMQQQLQQSNREMKRWQAECSRMVKEVELWKAECEALEEKVEVSVMQLERKAIERGKMEQDKVVLEHEASALKTTLQECHKELSTWKQDCVFFAMKFMNWGPTLLKWGPALHRELKLKALCIQKRKKFTAEEKNMTLRAKAGQSKE